jgi:hypothetical protein
MLREIVDFIFWVVLPFGAAYLLIGIITAYIGSFDRYTNISQNDRRFNRNATIMFWPFAICIWIGYFIITKIIIIPLNKGVEVVRPKASRAIEDLDGYVCRLFKREIHRDSYGILYEMPSRYGLMKQVRVEDSTGVYWIPVPRVDDETHEEIKRAKQAVAWTYSMKERDFNPVRV